MNKEKRTKASRRDQRAARMLLYVQQIARPAQKHGLDPNDRRHDREVGRAMKRIKPQELDALLNGEEES